MSRRFSRGVALTRAIGAALVVGWLARGASPRCASLLALAGASSAAAQATPEAKPRRNEPTRDASPALAPLPRPSAASAQQPASLLFQAIVQDDPALVETFFFPRDAFVQLKAIQRPELYWDKLHKRFQADIHALHRATPELARASFVRLELTARGGYVRPGEEGNKLPYWAARHAWLHYRADGQPRKLEVRVLISWHDRWYVIHLSEFH